MFLTLDLPSLDYLELYLFSVSRVSVWDLSSMLLLVTFQLVVTLVTWVQSFPSLSDRLLDIDNYPCHAEAIKVL